MATTLQLEHSSSSHKTRNASSFYRPELDVLRFFAFLAVFENHSTPGPASYVAQHHNPAWVGQLLQGISYAGGRGVDLFFALSAYLITELLLREKDQCGSLDVKSFYIRRILRIWPLFYLAIILAEAASLLKPDHPFGFGYFVAFALLAGNWSASVSPQQAAWLVAPLCYPERAVAGVPDLIVLAAEAAVGDGPRRDRGEQRDGYRRLSG